VRGSLPPVLGVALGGALGSVLRWWLSGAVQRITGSPFPWGTFTVNAVGSFAIGAIAALALERTLISPAMRVFLITGILGGFTTFSAFSYETFGLLRDAQWGAALGYAFGSVAVGVTCATLGFALAMRV
jgi:fluoride exporter